MNIAAQHIAIPGLGTAVVDAEDFLLVSRHSWHKKSGYACTSITKPRKHSVLMHRMILGAERGQIVDHIDGNRLDNRKSNLRIVSAYGSAWNRGSRKSAKGVFRCGDKFTSRILWHGEELYLGTFKNETLAACVYDAAALRLFGRHARLNGCPDFSTLDAALSSIRRLDGVRGRAIHQAISTEK